MAKEPKNTGAAAASTTAASVPVTGTATSAEALLSGAAAQEAAGAREPLKESPVGSAGDDQIVGAGVPIVEGADVSLDRTGEPASAEVRAERVPVHDGVLIDERADVSRDRRDEPASAELRAERTSAAGELRSDLQQAYADTTRFVGTLPAHTRVLAGGERVRVASRTDIGEEREFTAAVRTLRNRTIYEIGADVPLSRTEFVTKKAAGAILEMEWESGRTALD